MRIAEAGVALIASVAWAQARVEGRVVDTAGQPIARVELAMSDSPLPPTLLPAIGGAVDGRIRIVSNDDGTFVFDAIPAGRGYRLAAHRAGYVDLVYGTTPTDPRGTMFDLIDGQIVRDLTVVLVQQTAITGRITDQAGDPVPGARVLVSTYLFQRGERTLVPLGGVAADDQGVYRFANLAPGRVYVSVSDQARLTERAAERNEVTFFPSAADVEGARAIDVEAGEEIGGIDIRMRRVRIFNVRGRVVDEAGQPVSGSFLSARPRGQVQNAITRRPVIFQVRGEDGSFEVRGLAEGSHTIETVLGIQTGDPNFRIVPLIGSVDVTLAGSDVEGVTLTVGPGAILNGWVTLPDGDLAAVVGAASVAARRISFVPPPGLPSTVPANLTADGVFKVEGMVLAPHRMQMSLPDAVYVRRVRFRGDDVTREPLDLSKGGGELEIELSAKPADVAGIVAGNRRGVLVTLWPEAANRNDYNGGFRAAALDQNGAFRFGGLAPGAYFIAAWDGAPEGLLLNEQFRAQFAASAVRVDVSEGSHQAIEAPVIAADRIAKEEEKLP